MKKLEVSVDIHAPKEKVWTTLWDDATYRKWASVFMPSSHAVSDWQQGSNIDFLDGDGNGMFSIIEKNIPNREMTFRHQGEIKDGQRVKSEWACARESYFLVELNDITTVNVVMDNSEEWQSFFETYIPKALRVVKDLAERK